MPRTPQTVPKQRGSSGALKRANRAGSEVVCLSIGFILVLAQYIASHPCEDPKGVWSAEGKSVGHMVMGNVEAVTEAYTGEESEWTEKSHDV